MSVSFPGLAAALMRRDSHRLPALFGFENATQEFTAKPVSFLRGM
jgi:hypothetical protein